MTHPRRRRLTTVALTAALATGPAAIAVAAPAAITAAATVAETAHVAPAGAAASPRVGPARSVGRSAAGRTAADAAPQSFGPAEDTLPQHAATPIDALALSGTAVPATSAIPSGTAASLARSDATRAAAPLTHGDGGHDDADLAYVDVDGARVGLAAWLRANRPATSASTAAFGSCPLISLDMMGTAIADVGLTGTLAGWTAEIEWDEYVAIDRDLMGVVCSGETIPAAGNELELAASMVAIDAGTDDRAIDVIAGYGFGALDVVDADIAGVPDGELTTGCVSADALAACLTFWSLDGLIVGTTLWSDQQALPDGTSEAVLAALLPDTLAALAAQRDSGAAEPQASSPHASIVGDGTPVGDARAGLERVLLAPDTPATAPLDVCALADATTVEAALAVSGADLTIAGWGQWLGPLTGEDDRPQRAIMCTGEHIGSGDRSFPEHIFSLAVSDFGDDETLGIYLADHLGIAADEDPIRTPNAGGETIGRCAQRDRRYDCYEVWTDGSGFAVLAHIEDRTYFDRQSASAVVDQLVGPVLDSLGGHSSRPGDGLGLVDSGQVDGAQAGIVEFADSVLGRSGLDCPAATIEDVIAALGTAGVAARPADWSAELGELASTNDDEPALRLSCSDADELVTLDVIQFATPTDAAEFVATVGLADGGAPSDLDPETLVAGSCTVVSGLEYCNAWWRDGTFVIGITLFADAAAITRNDATDMLVELVPIAVARLEAIAG